MTHRDIYTKFMIEYDKALVTSSYPSLTEYEVATVLDKAYNALIAQKVTGNNYRRVPFEADIKAISDLQPLVSYKKYGRPFSDSPIVVNQLDFALPTKSDYEGEFLYYVGCRLEGNIHKASTPISQRITPVDTTDYTFPTGITNPGRAFIIPIAYTPIARIDIISSVGTNDSAWYMGDVTGKTVTSVGDPYETISATEGTKQISAFDNMLNHITSMHDNIIIWPANISIKDDDFVIWSRNRNQYDDNFPYDRETYRMLPCQIVDYNTAQKFFTSAYNMPWIKNPVCYIHGDVLHVVKEDDTISNYDIQYCVLTYIRKPATFVKDLKLSEQNQNFFDSTEFELNETMAEELISLGIAIALENIESPRLNSKLNMRGLEA